MPVSKPTSRSSRKSKVDQSAPVPRAIQFDDGDWPETPAPSTPPVQNPETYGFLEFVLPDEQIDYDDAESRKHTLSIYRSYCLNLRAFESRAKGYARWHLGVVLNRLKDVRGGAKSVPHGEFINFLKALKLVDKNGRVKDDFAEEVRWVALAVSKDDARTMGWTKMRDAGIALRKQTNSAKHDDPDVIEENDEDDLFADITAEQRASATIDGKTWDEMDFDERRAVAKGLGVKIPKRTKSKPAPASSQSGAMTPEKWESFFARVNKMCADKLDAEWAWGGGNREDASKRTENALNHLTAIEGKCKTFRARLTKRLDAVRKVVA